MSQNTALFKIGLSNLTSNIYISMMTMKITPIIEFNIRDTFGNDCCAFYRPDFCIFNTYFIMNSKELDKHGPVVIQESIKMLAVYKWEPMKMFLTKHYFYKCLKKVNRELGASTCDYNVKC